MIPFTHLHLHTQYSILDGACNIKDLMAKVTADGMTAVAITDHGNMFGVMDFIGAATKAGVKPIIGCEVYVANNSRHDKDKNDKDDRSGNHLVLLAKNKQGYQNLVKMVSASWVDGFYYKPRIDKDLLRQYHEGIIASTACLGGEIPRLIEDEQMEKAEETLLFFKELFGEDFYIELQRHQSGNPEMDRDVYQHQVKVNAGLIELSQKYNVKIIATNDVHFINAEDAEAHDILICLNTGKDFDDEGRMRYTRQEYFKTQKEMNDLFTDIPQAIENTNEIVNKIELYQLKSEPVMPHFPIPDTFTDGDDYLAHLTYEGAKVRYGEITDTIRDRLDFELGVIKRMGFPGYFLIVRDFLQEARRLGVAVGPGRGSAAGSVVAYCNYITDIDPIHYKLLFERFLNPDRISMPDIDIDFDEDGRERVIEYVINKYGENRVAQIITFGTMAAKMAIRDVARVLRLPLPDADRIAKLVPERAGVSLKEAFNEVNELKQIRDAGSELEKKTLRFAQTLEGSVRQIGTHPCGIIIAREDLNEYLPVCRVKESKMLVTQYEGSFVENVGMLKMDFLGLKTLSIIKDAVNFIKQSQDVDIVLEKIPLDDAKTYELYSKGETTGLFQFESPGMKKYLKDLKPNRFEDLIAMNALFRPGPMDYIPSFIKRKHGKEKIVYDFPVMEDYLTETYGITVYQEQVMLLSQAMAGFTGGEADSLRKAMGKKLRDVMDKMKTKFIDGCKNKGMDVEKVTKIWTDWESFAEYAFNKSHSTCYAQVSYQTGYLKANYPADFMSAVLSRNLSDIKKITIFMDECRRMGIQVLGPDVNESNMMFTPNKAGNIRFGIGAVKGVGEAAVEKIIEERKASGPYKDIFDFVTRVNLQAVNKKSFEALAVAGGFDAFADVKRYQYFAKDDKGISWIEHLMRFGAKMQQDKNGSGGNLFGDSKATAVVKPDIPHSEEWNTLYTLSQEKDVIGMYLSAHPLDEFKFEIDTFANVSLADMHDMPKVANRDLSIAGMITEAKHATGKNGKPYASVIIEDYTDTYKFMLFSQDYMSFKNYLTKGYSLLIKGKVQARTWGGRENSDNPEMEFKIKTMELLANVKEAMVKSISLRVSINDLSDDLIESINGMSDDKHGKALLKFIIFDPEENLLVEMFSRTRRVNVTNDLIKFLQSNPEIVYKVN